MSRHVIHVTVDFHPNEDPADVEAALVEIREGIIKSVSDDFGVDTWGDYSGARVTEVWAG